VSIDSQNSASRRLKIPVTVILERRLISRSFWSLPSWYLHTVAVGQHLVASGENHQINERQADSLQGVPAGSTDKGELFAWTGFEVTLYKDACERYWHALIGDKPLVYVVCRDDIDDDSGQGQNLQPLSVTIDYDEASAGAETDDPVLSTAIPGELYRAMEAFVLQHYHPKPFKKRKRRNWSAASDGGKRT